MQVQTTTYEPSFASIRRSAPAEGIVAGITPATQASRERESAGTVTLPRDPAPEAPETEERDTEPQIDGYRLNFDSEKKRVFLEFLNPATGDVIQRLPRDDLEDAFTGGSEKVDVRV